MAIIEEIQVFEQESGRVQMVLVGRLMKVNEKTIMVEHDIDCIETGGGRCGLTYPILPHWNVRTRLAGAPGDFVTRFKGWDRRVGSHLSGTRPGRPRLVATHQTSSVHGPYNAGNGRKGGYGKGR